VKNCHLQLIWALLSVWENKRFRTPKTRLNQFSFVLKKHSSQLLIFCTSLILWYGSFVFFLVCVLAQVFFYHSCAVAYLVSSRFYFGSVFCRSYFFTRGMKSVTKPKELILFVNAKSTAENPIGLLLCFFFFSFSPSSQR